MSSMTNILAFLGMCTVFATVVIIAVFFFVRYRWRSFMRTLASSGGAATPARINLLASDVSSWHERTKADAACAALEALGFRRVAYFTAPEMPQLRMAGFVKPDEQLMAAVYDIPGASVWTDVVLKRPDDSSITASNAPDMGRLDAPPGRERFYDTGTDAAGLLGIIREHRGGGDALTIEADAFKGTFEKAYADEMDWRAARGTTREEIERVAAASGQSYSAEVIDATHEIELENNRQQLLDACMDSFRRGPDAPSDWASFEERGICITEQSTSEDVLDEAVAAGMIDESFGTKPPHVTLDELGIDATVPPIELFATLAERAPASRRPSRIGSVVQPVRAEFWLTHAHD